MSYDKLQKLNRLAHRINLQRRAVAAAADAVEIANQRYTTKNQVLTTMLEQRAIQLRDKANELRKAMTS